MKTPIKKTSSYNFSVIKHTAWETKPWQLTGSKPETACGQWQRAVRCCCCKWKSFMVSAVLWL